MTFAPFRLRLAGFACVALAAVAVAFLFPRPVRAGANAAGAPPARELAPATRGRCTVSWTPATGLDLRINGVPLVRRSSLYVVKAGWSGLLLDQRSAPATITPWTDSPSGAKTARVALENADAVCVYTLTLAPLPQETLTVDMVYRLKRDVAAEIEYAAAYLSGPVLQGARFVAATGEADPETARRISALSPAPGRTQEQNRLAPPFSHLDFSTRLASFRVTYAGTAPALPVVFDARSDAQGWAREFPVFWMGLGSPPVPLRLADGERRATFTFALTPAGTFSSEVGKAPTQAQNGPGVRAIPDARVPVVPAGLPLVIPRPKQIAAAKEPFRLTPATRIVVADGATVEDKQGAEMLRRDLQTRFNLDAPLVRARDASVVQGRNVIVIGDGERNALLSRLLAAQNAPGPPNKPEGYAVYVSARAVLVAGYDPAGALWGVQTLRQLLAPDPAGGAAHAAQVLPVRIADWPTLSVRGVHLFHGKNALPFHQKLIDRVLSRCKMNALFLQAEQLRWNADPAIAPPWAGRKADVKAEIAFAQKRGLTVYPLVQSLGHMEWLFAGKRNLQFAEDPETPYALQITNPAATRHLGSILTEADDLFGAPAFHVGLDEVTMRGRFPHRSQNKTFADLFLAGANTWHDLLSRRRGKQMWMWADMLLYAPEVAPSFGTAPSAADAARLRRELPKDIVVVDWQYSPRPNYPSLKVLKDAGFPVVAATWYDADGIQKFSRAAAEAGALGAIQTTWAGYESRESVLNTAERKQFSAMVYAADYFWNGGAGPAPADLPYEAGEVFTRAYTGPVREDTRTRQGWLVDLSPVATRPLADWLGYGGELGLANISSAPAGTRLGDGVCYVRDNVLLLSGKLGPAGADLPAARTITLGDVAANEVRLLVATSHRTNKGTNVGKVTLTTTSGKTRTVPLVYGENIASADDLATLPGAPLAWRGRFDGGAAGETPPAGLRALTVFSPAPGETLRSVTLSSTNTEAAPALFALTALK